MSDICRGKKHDHKPGIYPRWRDAKGRERYLIRYELPRDPSTGKRCQKSEIFYGIKREAEKRLREILVQIDQKTFTMPSDMTVAQYMEEWLEKYRADHPVESTGDTARYLITKHIIAEIGHLKLAELVPYHLDKLYQKLRKKLLKTAKGFPPAPSATSTPWSISPWVGRPTCSSYPPTPPPK